MADSTGSFTVGDWLVEPELDQITRNSESTGLRSQVMDLLVYLARHEGRVVSADDLLDDLWTGKVVSSGTVYNCVGELRHALADGKDPHTYIETIPKKGYRLLAPVAGLDDEPGSVDGTGRNLIFAIIGLMAVAILYLGLDNYVFEQTLPETTEELAQDATPPEGRIMLAVLPLKNLSGDPEQEYFSDGLTEELIAHLGSLQRDRLGVIARTSAMYYKGKNKRIDEIARELGVDYLLEGSVRHDGDRVRITAQLIQASDQSQLWAESFEHDLDDIFALQNEVAQRVARTLRLELLPAEQARPRRVRPANAAAYEAFQKGRSFDDRHDREKLLTAIKHYEEAVRADPGYALAYTALSHAWGTLGWAEYIPIDEAHEKEWYYLRKAAALDPDLAEVEVLFAEFRMYDIWDWPGAEAGLRRAFESDPGSEMAVWHYNIILSLLGRFQEALEVANRGLRLNPHSRWINERLAEDFRNLGQYEQAIERYRRTIELAPKKISYQSILGDLYEKLGREDEAVEVYLNVRNLVGDSTERIQALRDAYSAGGLRAYWRQHLEQLLEARENIPPLPVAKIYARLGEKEHGLAWVEKLEETAKQEHVPPLAFARIYTRLGDKDQALAWLEKAYDQRSRQIVSLKVSRTWDPLRDDLHFQDLLRRMNYPE